MPWTLEQNLADLPLDVVFKLAVYINRQEVLKQLVQWFDHHLFDSGNRLEERMCLRYDGGSPTERLLRQAGNNGATVRHLLEALDKTRLVEPQLVLRRKFCAVKLVSQVRLLLNRGDVGSTGTPRLHCRAVGFPYPLYQWYYQDEAVQGERGNELSLAAVSGSDQVYGSYHCVAWNEIADGEEWSRHYRKAGRTYSSELVSATVLLNRTNLPLGALLAGSVGVGSAEPNGSGNGAEQKEVTYSASDKVALIICNSDYEKLPRLRTPACDAETLAEQLLQVGFKTVTVSDLTLTEMTAVIQHYRRLLGDSIYSVFYFVGHGFEAAGQCYLLPVDASHQDDVTAEQCVSVDWLLSVTQQRKAALNLVMLDVCRTNLPPDRLASFSAQTEKYTYKVWRNTVFGYATSVGVGAYEVLGEQNGIFMKYLKNYLKSTQPIVDILGLVLRDLEDDPKASDHQFPELRTNLSRPLSLADPIEPTGHTVSFDHRTFEWQSIHELPDPITVKFAGYCVQVTVWFDYCGHFTNMVYAFTNVTELSREKEAGEHSGDSLTLKSSQTECSKQFLAYIRFRSCIATVHETVCSDNEEGLSVRVLAKQLQKAQDELDCALELRRRDDNCVLEEADVSFGRVLIMKLALTTNPPKPLA